MKTHVSAMKADLLNRNATNNTISLPSPRRTTRPPYQVSKTISSSITFDIKSCGVLSMYSPRVRTFPSLPPGTLKSRTSLARASAASVHHSELRKESVRLDDSLSKNWITLQQIVFCAVVSVTHYGMET